MTARTVPKGLAPLLELLELEQPRVVTGAQLAEWASRVGVRWPAAVVVRQLRERGWLLDLQTRGVWEFAPAARAGAFGSGDPFIELRASLARNPDAPYAVAAESAAYMLGLASRRSAREAVSAPPSSRPPKALAGFRVVRWSARAKGERLEGLPVWSTATLLAFMATRPGGYGDWPNVGEWLRDAAARVEVDDVLTELEGRPRSAWARAAYLLGRGQRPESAQRVLSAAPAGDGPYYLGERRGAPGRFWAEFDVVDSTGLEVAVS